MVLSGIVEGRGSRVDTHMWMVLSVGRISSNRSIWENFVRIFTNQFPHRSDDLA